MPSTTSDSTALLGQTGLTGKVASAIPDDCGARSAEGSATSKSGTRWGSPLGKGLSRGIGGYWGTWFSLRRGLIWPLMCLERQQI